MIGGNVVLKGNAKVAVTVAGRFGGTSMKTVTLSSEPKMFLSLIKKTFGKVISSRGGLTTIPVNSYSIA